MVDQEKLREITQMGEGEQAPPPQRGKPAGLGTVALFQGLVCALLLLALLLARAAGWELFQQAAQWYRQESAAQVQLPGWGGDAAGPGEDGDPI